MKVVMTEGTSLPPHLSLSVSLFLSAFLSVPPSLCLSISPSVSFFLFALLSHCPHPSSGPAPPPPAFRPSEHQDQPTPPGFAQWNLTQMAETSLQGLTPILSPWRRDVRQVRRTTLKSSAVAAGQNR